MPSPIEKVGLFLWSPPFLGVGHYQEDPFPEPFEVGAAVRYLLPGLYPVVEPCAAARENGNPSLGIPVSQ